MQRPGALPGLIVCSILALYAITALNPGGQVHKLEVHIELLL